ncbi:oplophorus-luciferin 2-monooxygenase non-catalytic subunit-like [Panulirus ornatus]|uniref:oplophorus-luciferin 2-monooxygenase non-catalytic subunit-like n=1 Tax=Panulirus ornatus TaxID=150431 RepID=UPI003A8760D1
MLPKFLMVGLVAGFSHSPLTAALASGLLKNYQPILPYEWPCPDAVSIQPCSCTADEYKNMRIDCSQVRNNNELARVFNVTFPFEHFLELKIDHDPSDQNNDLSALNPGVFHALTFERVIIKGTRLTVVEENAFSKSHDTLKYMNLANNRLEKFPFETIVSYTRLDSLVLDDNNLKVLPVLESESLQVLSVSGNTGLIFEDIVFFSALSLTRINMARIGLRILSPDIFSKLNYSMIINLEQNNLHELDVFAFNPPTKSLLQVLLNQNKISKVRHDFITGLAEGADLNMANNEITDMPEEIWKPIFDQVPSGFIDLSGNPLSCGCDMAWIYLEPTGKYRTVFTDTTTCYDGTQVTFLDEHFFQIQCTGET